MGQQTLIFDLNKAKKECSVVPFLHIRIKDPNMAFAAPASLNEKNQNSLTIRKTADTLPLLTLTFFYEKKHSS